MMKVLIVSFFIKHIKLKIVSIYIQDQSVAEYILNPFLKMIFTTQIELNITIKDINAIYSTEYEQMLMDHARLMYEKKCRDGQYVKSIDRLIKRSMPNLIKRDLNAKVRVYIVVEATVIRYDQYDFITGMNINKIIPAGKIGNFDMIECRNDHVVALMKVQKGIENFKVNDKIIIRVGQSMYKIGNGHILINGYPFLPYVPEQICYTIGNVSESDIKYYNETTLPLLKRELTRKDSLDQKRWKFFADLLHPYKKEKKISNGFDLLKIESIKNGNYGIDYHANLGNLSFTKFDSVKSSGMVINESSKFGLTRIAFQFIKFLEVVNDLCEEYPDDKSYSKLDYIWSLYIENKL